ncbi:hypothetical protein N9A04_00630 [Rickettsiales bacterium]|nr:hypothetical protein [Rickettsiales bacterium]
MMEVPFGLEASFMRGLHKTEVFVDLEKFNTLFALMVFVSEQSMLQSTAVLSFVMISL